MKTSNENEKAPDEAWPVRPYSKRELAEAYAPNISPVSALNRLAQWFKYNLQLSEALLQTGYKKTPADIYFHAGGTDIQIPGKTLNN